MATSGIVTIHPSQRALAQVGAKVRQRLAADRSVHRIPTDEIEIFAVGKFLTPAECTRMIGIIDAVAKPSALFETPYSAGQRTSFSGDVDPGDPFIKMIERRISDLLGIPLEYGETVQGQRYEVGQEFKPHQDYFHTSQSYWKDEKDRGGQRSWTTMVFLNNVEEGGATVFPSMGLRIPPQEGALLIWNNMGRNGSPNPKTLHAGTPVVRGTKYIITKWFRAAPWGLR